MATTDDLSKLILDLEVRLDKSTEKQSKDICDQLYKLHDSVRSGSVRRRKYLVLELICDVAKRIECIELADESTADWATFVQNASHSQVSLPPPSKRDKTTQKVKYFSNALCYDISSAGPGPSSVSLKGRLKACIRFWISIGVYQTVHEII